MRDVERITVYTADSPLLRPTQFFKEMMRDLLASRELAWRLFIRDIQAQYRQTLLGYVWAFLPPLATSLTFMFLSSQQILSIGATPIPYPAFVLIGTTLWQTFVDALNAPLKLVQSSREMLAKINFPREALILAGLGEVLFNFAIRSVILVFAILWFKIPISYELCLAPLGVASLIAFGLMLGILVTPIGMLYQDVSRGLLVVTGFWMLLTPVIYPTPRTWPASLLSKWNPVSTLIVSTREWLTGSAGANPAAFLAVTAATLILTVLGWILYRLAMPHLVERMGG